MQLYLFSSGSALPTIVQRTGEHLAGAAQPTIALIPAASVDQQATVERLSPSFAPLGTLRVIDLDTTDDVRFAADLAASEVIYVPGGNTYLLARRMHRGNFMRLLVEAVRAGTPLLGSSAGTVFCGPNMLTTNDWNVFATTTFDGLGLCPCNFNVHFTLPPPEESESHDFRIRQYITANHNPVLALEEACYLDWSDTQVRVEGATAWHYTVDGARRPLAPGSTVEL
jgi:dipeptidase E